LLFYTFFQKVLPGASGAERAFWKKDLTQNDSCFTNAPIAGDGAFFRERPSPSFLLPLLSLAKRRKKERGLFFSGGRTLALAVLGGRFSEVEAFGRFLCFFFHSLRAGQLSSPFV
jgi:hypothetical protein